MNLHYFRMQVHTNLETAMKHVRGLTPAVLAALVAGVVGLAGPSATAAAQGGETRLVEQWYCVMFGNQRMGWMHMRETQHGEHIVSERTLHMAMSRGGRAIEIGLATSFTETKDGRPVRAQKKIAMSQVQVVETAEYTDEGIKITTTQLGQSQTRVIATSDQDWLPPAAAARFVRERFGEHADDIDVWIVDFLISPAPGHVKMKRIGVEQIEYQDKTVDTSVWQVWPAGKRQIMSTEYFDATGRLLKESSEVMGVQLVMIASNEQAAKGKVTPMDLDVVIFVKPDRLIANPRQTRSAIYDVSADAGEDPGADDATAPSLSLPRTSAQRVVYDDANTARVVIDLDAPQPPGDDVATDEHLRANAALNHEDEKIRELLNEVFRGRDMAQVPAQVKARALHGFVHGYVKAQDLSVGFATASEVARTKNGDCSKHAVLLAAMLRGAGVRSRIASGLLYIDKPFLGQSDVFGYHMWTQAWLPFEADDDGVAYRWVDLDATLSTPFDAAHITLMVTALNEYPMGFDMIDAVSAFTKLNVKVIEAN